MKENFTGNKIILMLNINLCLIENKSYKKNKIHYYTLEMM